MNSVDDRRSGTRHPALLGLAAAVLALDRQVMEMEVLWVPRPLLLLQQQDVSFALR